MLMFYRQVNKPGHTPNVYDYLARNIPGHMR